MSSVNRKKVPQTKLNEYGTVALVLQGGGALGAYQAGVVKALHDSGVDPNWVAGISIGALNAAIIAGNPPEQRAEKLQQFWDTICQPPWLPNFVHTHFGEHVPESWHNVWFGVDGALEATRTVMEGQAGFFVPRWQSPFPLMHTASTTNASFYDTSLLKETLLDHADFDRINSGDVRVSIGAVQVATGNMVYFDNTQEKLIPEHFMASGALPPGFPAVEIEGEFYWDGGLVSNTPLSRVLCEESTDHALIFQVDLWSAAGKLPDNLMEVSDREKSIRYSSRTRQITDLKREQNQLNALFSELIDLIPEDKQESETVHRLKAMIPDQRVNLFHVIYRDQPYETYFKDFQFGLSALHNHWRCGEEDIDQILSDHNRLALPSVANPFITHDLGCRHHDRCA